MIRFAWVVFAVAVAAMCFFFALLGLAAVDRENPVLQAAITVAPWAGGLAAIVLAALTAMYVAATQGMAKATAQLADETRRQREESTAPLVIVYFDFQRWLLFVTVQNIGGGLARNVRATFEPAVPSLKGPISELPVTTHNIPALRPREKFSHLVNVAHAFFATAGRPNVFTAIVTYDDINGNPKEPLRYPLNIAVYEGLLMPETEGIGELVKHVKDIRRILDQITDFSSLRIKTPQDTKREQDERLARMDEENAQEPGPNTHEESAD